MYPNVIKNLDLEPIIVKAIDSEEGYGWSLELAQQIAEEYRKYLTLCLDYANKAIVPAKMIDDFWHLHILDTQKYAEDCQVIFGYFLHHFPYFGMRGEEDAKNLSDSWEETCNLYQNRFGSLSELWVSSARCPNCGRRSPTDTGMYAMDIRPTLNVA